MLPELGLRSDARLPTKASLKPSGCSISPPPPAPPPERRQREKPGLPMASPIAFQQPGPKAPWPLSAPDRLRLHSPQHGFSSSLD